jgi:hypothetical protein
MGFDPNCPLETASGCCVPDAPLNGVRPAREEIADDPAAASRNKLAA